MLISRAISWEEGGREGEETRHGRCVMHEPEVRWVALRVSHILRPFKEQRRRRNRIPCRFHLSISILCYRVFPSLLFSPFEFRIDSKHRFQRGESLKRHPSSDRIWRNCEGRYYAEREERGR